MKLPEPVGWQQVSTGQVWLFKANKDDLALFTEAQLREALAQHEAVMRQALSAIRAVGMSGTATKKARDTAAKALVEALGSLSSTAPGDKPEA